MIINENFRLLQGFEPHFEKIIYPIYKQHEDTFDIDKIHGVLHIARSIIASYILSCKCNEIGLHNNLEDILIATAFHDSGRQNGGTDYWEGISSSNCEKFINQMEFNWGEKITNNSASLVASYIIKSNQQDSTNFKCIHDSDCLEVMRPCTGRDGINGFIPSYMKLYSNEQMKPFLDSLVYEWWNFVYETESNKIELSTPNCLERLIDLLILKKEYYPIINSFLC